MVIHVIDNSRPFSDADSQLAGLYAGKPSVVAINKVDLNHKAKLPNGSFSEIRIDVSCVTGQGKELLEMSIEKQAIQRIDGQSIDFDVAINERHKNAILRSIQELNRGINEMESGTSLDITAQSYRASAQSIGEIVGKTSTEDILDSIFSNFCIGK